MRDKPVRPWGSYLHAAREAAGLSRPELAKRIGVGKATIYRWEYGETTPDQADLVVRVARELGVDLDEALTAAGMRPGSAVDRPAHQEPPLSHRLRLLRDLLADPDVSDDDKRLIEAQLDHLATMARRLRSSPRGD